MTPEPLFEVLAQARIVPVVEIVDPDQAVPLAHALTDAGLPLMEVTLRTPGALEAIRAIHDELPDFIVGAGTLLTAAQVGDAATAGAQFGVAPGFSPELSRAASDAGLPFVPGAVTASEVLAALALGHTHLKFFPAESSGGVKAIESLAGPFAGMGITFMPTGGVRLTNLDAYLAVPHVFAVGGTWIAPRDAITAGNFTMISAEARHALTRAVAARSV